MTIAVIAGEPSGERLAAEFVTALSAIDRELRFIGVGGERMEAAGVDLLFPSSDLSLVGLAEVLRSYRGIRRRFDELLEQIDTERTDLLVTVDFPGFNLRLAAEAGQRGVPTLHIVSPQVWAWRPWRLRRIRRSIDELIVLFPFEVEFYRSRGMEVHYFGHPGIDRYMREANLLRRSALDWRGDDPRPVVAHLPGSRRSELERHLPVLAETIRLLGHEKFRHVVSRVPELPAEIYTTHLESTGCEFQDDVGLLLESASVALVKTGTATLDAVAAGVPFAAFYRSSGVTAFLARHLARVDYLAMPNILAGREVVTEFLQENMTPQRLADEVHRLADAHEQSRMRDAFAEIVSQLASKGANSIEMMARFAWRRFLGRAEREEQGVS